MLDVVIVSDFSNLEHDHVRNTSGFAFLCRTLLFIGAWMENAGDARSWPLHLAAIGRAPEIISEIADRYGVSITEFEPHPLVSISPVANKFYAWQIPRKTDHMLLLDVDAVLFKDPSRISRTCGNICVTPTFVNRCPMHMWEELYSILEINMPVRRMISICGQTGLYNKNHKYNNYQSLPPFYNGGVVMAPWSCDLGELWQRNFDLFFQHFAGQSQEWQDVVSSDQPALSVTVETLRSQGTKVRWMPHGVNVWTPLLISLDVSCDETILYHAANLFRDLPPDADHEKEVLKFINSASEQSRELQLCYEKLGNLILRHVVPKLQAIT